MVYKIYPSFILCTTSISHPPFMATCVIRYLKESTSCYSSSFSLTFIWPQFTFLEYLITLILPSFTRNILLSYITWKWILLYTLSGCIGKVVASHAEGCREKSQLRLHSLIQCTTNSGGTAHEARGCDQSIEFTVSDGIVHSLLWSTATRSSLLGYFSRLLQVVDNWPNILW